jgi:asparagine synthase (glutamine-hydrolysing)
MCGIAGFQGKGTKADAARMIACINYRGPDLQAATLIGDTALAHARLSIIDLSHGADQPMADAEGRFTIVFNGEIYNYRELRDALIKKGRVFRTASDTEVLLHLYAEHGEALLPMLNGMWAFAIHDARDNSLFLARDRMGKKPLHYTESNGTFVFGSELKAVLAHPAVKHGIDLHALNEYLTFEYVPTPRSIVQGVRKLRPGHGLRVRGGRAEAEHPYWSPDFSKVKLPVGEAMARLDETLGKATQRRLMSDVPLGVFLSGGLDSSTVAYYAQRASSQRIKTFSIGFKESSYDESTYARSVADHLGTDHHVQILSEQDSLDLIAPLYATLDEPFADASLIPTHLLSQFTRQQVTVALGGDGSDELLAGYPTFIADRYRRFMGALPKGLIRLMQGTAALLPASDSNISLDFKIKQFLRGFGHGPQHVHTLWLGSFTPAEKKQLFTREVLAELSSSNGLEPIDALLGAAPPKGRPLDVTTYTYLLTYLLDDILFKVDRASMYSSLEVRAPFLDVEVVELLNSLPESMKRPAAGGKWLLKELMRGKLPDTIIIRPKKGFGIPLSGWLRGPLRPLCEELLSPEAIRAGGLFNVACIEQLKRQHFTRKANHRKLLWTLMVFQMWVKGQGRTTTQL